MHQMSKLYPLTVGDDVVHIVTGMSYRIDGFTDDGHSASVRPAGAFDERNAQIPSVSCHMLKRRQPTYG